MTETTQGDPAKAVEIAQKIVAILINENSETRRRAIQAAMVLLGETPPASSSSKAESETLDISGDNDTDLERFFNRDEKLKPSDCAYLCAAQHYSMHGTAAFSLEEIRTIANDAGVILPDRLDKTFNAAAKNGRKLFQVAGKGSFRPTASAGLFFKERWDIKPGKRAKSAKA